LWYRSALVDFATGALGAIAVLMAVHARNRGVGSVAVETSLLATALFLMSELIQRSDGEFHGAPLLNADKTGFHPAEQLYGTRDGWIAIAARSEQMAAALIGALGIPGVASPRKDWDDSTAERIGVKLAALDTESAIALLQDAGVWVERCVTNGWEALRDAKYARAAQLVIDAEDSVYGRIVSTFGPLIRFSRSAPAEPFRSAPQPGEHTKEILADMGVPSGEVQDLMASGIVR
jgi:crotonobetainyl-CoA:carnitine CoA-transferase CaiB-like acyl-CoA transferase